MKGDLDSLPDQLKALLEKHSETSLEPWIEIVVSGDSWISDFQCQVQEMTEDMALEVLRVRRQRKEREKSLTRENKDTLAELLVKDVFNSRLEQEELNDKTIGALTSAFDSVVAEIEEEQLLGSVIKTTVVEEPEESTVQKENAQ